MKKFGKLILVFTVLFYVNSTLAQDKNNQWQVSFGTNAVDFHPVGTDTGDNATGHWFSEYFNIQDNCPDKLTYFSPTRLPGKLYIKVYFL